MQKDLPTVTEAEFQREVLESPLPVLLEFGAEWCGPCRAIEPVMAKIAERHDGKVRVLAIDADASAAIASRYRVRALPTVISFVGGQEHKRHAGATSMDVLLRLLPTDLAATT
ncbi:MAG: thioredoxin [Labilithrix sp.]|nr:thioredoxin [Labilithrix sp.]